MTGPAMRSTPATGPPTSTHASDGNYGSAPTANYGSAPASYGSTPAASYASNPAASYGSTPTASYATTASTPAAALAASYASTHASTPSSTSASSAAASHTGDYVSGEQYRYALTNFVRTHLSKISLHFPLTGLPIPHMGSDSDSRRPSHIRRSRNSGPSSKSRSGRSHGSKHA